MSVDRRFFERPSGVLGVLVHGSAVVARSRGIALGVRCVLAYPGGLEVDLVLRAVGVQAEAAARQTFGVTRPAGDIEDTWRGGSEPVLLVEVDGRRVFVDLSERSSSGGGEEFDSELRVGVSGLPSDGLVVLTASWPQAGLAEGSVSLTLGALDDLESRVVVL